MNLALRTHMTAAGVYAGETVHGLRRGRVQLELANGRGEAEVLLAWSRQGWDVAPLLWEHAGAELAQMLWLRGTTEKHRHNTASLTCLIRCKQASAMSSQDSRATLQDEERGGRAVSYTHLTLPTTPYV